MVKSPAMSAPTRVVQVAIPTPLRCHFDYLVPQNGAVPQPGARVRVAFGRQRQVVGVVLNNASESALAPERLKPIGEILDNEPLLPPRLLQLLTWAADYYHHAVGDVIHTALPALLRQGNAASAPGVTNWVLTQTGGKLNPGELTRAPLQQRLLGALAEAPQGLAPTALGRISPGWSAAMKILQSKGWVGTQQRDCLQQRDVPLLPAPRLTPAQQEAVQAVSAKFDAFAVHLLHGVTGSGKTEVYLQLIERAVQAQRQALVLVPEIALTPQFIQRFEQRFNMPVAVLHSGLSDQERLCAWLSARVGKASIVLGTRSAVFTPLAKLGLIVVDEEHDPSYKQQDGFRYSARDVAVMRARREQVPVILGSATPSLESIYHTQSVNYRILKLPDRTGDARLPQVRVLDMRSQVPVDGLSHPLRVAVAQRLARGEQSLLFLNRRGFAPVLMCHACGWLAPCRRCDARLTLHQHARKLRCHHCGAEAIPPTKCPACSGAELRPVGEGTERIETTLTRLFPEAKIIRIDRDTTRRKGSLEEKLRDIHAGDADILVGTQMLSKGHDFPAVTLVGVVNADQGLYSADFRAAEHLFQRIMQVSGRAGRADKPGEVLIQTYHPEHPIFKALSRHDYNAFAEYTLAERRETNYPPFAYLALLRAEAPQLGAALNFLHMARDLGREIIGNEVEIMEPVPAPMERRAGRYRAQLLVQASKRPPLHNFLSRWIASLSEDKLGRKVRWSLDVDPIDMY